MPPRKLVTGMLLAAGSLAGSVLVRRRAARRRERVDLYADDGSMHSFAEGTLEAERLLPIAHDLLALGCDPRRARPRPARRGLPRRRLRAALGPPLEVLPRQVPVRDAPRSAAPARRGDRGRRARARARGGRGSPGPSSARSRSPPRRRSRSGLPFLIVRKEAKELRDLQPARRRLRAEGESVCLVEDVVTSGGAAIEAVEALREAGLRVQHAICVVDREEGGVDELARHAVRLWPLFRASELLEIPANPHG